MATAAGASVRTVFDGEVSAVFRPDGYNNVVVIRHGRYMTVYANLGSLSVSTGQKVKAGSLSVRFIPTLTITTGVCCILKSATNARRKILSCGSGGEWRLARMRGNPE